MSTKHRLHPGTIAILTYHSLDDSGGVLSTTPRVFAEQMRLIHELGATVVPLGEVGRALDGAAASENLVAITFDDGFSSVYEHGLPVLRRYGFPATVFLVTDYCGKTNDWPSQPSGVARRPLLRWAEVREMSEAGIAFGSHTRTHPDLRTVARRDAEQEMAASKKAVEDATGRPADTFAYPYGAFDDAVKRLAAAHFTLACSAVLGFARSGGDRHAVERLDAYYLQRPAVLRRLFSPEIGAYIGLRRRLRRLRRHAPRWLDRLGHGQYS
jgi:peptidoglycan/xylan/chitin deacetylase (PgdA/CDA1 family)